MKRSVLITGVAGGIGHKTAECFAKDGWHVIGVDRRPLTKRGAVHEFFQVDISLPESPRQVFEAITKKHRVLNALVNNASIQITKKLVDTTPEEWDAVMASNIRSIYLSIREAYPMLKRAKGSIVNISSVHAISTSPGIAAYAASKGALLALTRAVALEMGPEQIRVNAVLPGAVDTPMLHAGLSRSFPNERDTRALVRGFGKKHVMGRVGKPEDIARLIIFLADNKLSAFMTGQAIVIDGGATARLSTE